MPSKDMCFRRSVCLVIMCLLIEWSGLLGIYAHTPIHAVSFAMAQTTPSEDNSSSSSLTETLRQPFGRTQDRTQGERNEGDVFLQEGDTLWEKGNLQQALEMYQKAASWFNQARDFQKEGETLVRIGAVYTSQRYYPEALESFQHAVNIFKDLPNRKDEGRTLSYIGRAYFDQSRYEEALQYFQQALEIAGQETDVDGEGMALNGMGEAYRNQGHFTEALHCYHQAIEIARKLVDPIAEGRNLINIGNAHVDLGQYKDAFQAYQQALTLLEQKEDFQGVGTIYISRGVTYTRLGDYQKALENFQKAREILKQIVDKGREATVLTGIGLVYDDKCQENSIYCLEALNVYQQAIKIQEHIDDRGGKGNALHNIGGGYDRLGWDMKVPAYHQQALQFYLQSLSITEAIGKPEIQAKTLNNLGEVHIHLSFYEEKEAHLQQALIFLDKALAIQQRIENRAREWITLGNIGWVYELQGKLQEALTRYEQSIKLLEQIIVFTGGLEEVKISLDAQIATTYQRTILLFMRMGQAEQAFEFSERARARVLLDQLGNIRLRPCDKVDESLLAQEHALRLERAELDRRHREQLAKPEEQHDQELLQLIEAQQEQKHHGYEELLLKIELSNPEYASLVRVEPLTLSEVQQLLNPETTLLSYFVTADTTLAFIITHDAFNTVELPVGKGTLEETIAKTRGPGRPSDPPPKALEDLYAELIKPLKQYLTTPVIGIIPHDVLHYLPFAALTDGQDYLSEDYTLFSLPSASVLQFLQNKQKSGDNNKFEGPGVGTVLALANGQAEGWPPLYEVEGEVRAIARLYKTRLLIGEHATESGLQEYAHYHAILHLAAHGELNTSSPLFSRIVLSPDQDNDGALEVHEVYDLNLQQTDLVVLSACETQLGKRSAGDDIVGLNRAFMYAGTPSVIASLWKVNDWATKDFMTAFYTQLKKGKSKAEALQIAQKKTRDRYPHPYYWAAFVLTGDPGTTIDRFPWLKVLIIGLIIAGILVIFLKNKFAHKSHESDQKYLK